MQLNRRRFLFSSAAIVAASNLMPSHSIAHILEPGPRSIILSNMARIERELKWANAMDREVNMAVTTPCLDRILDISNQRLPVTTPERVGECFEQRMYRDLKTAPDDILPLVAAKTVLGTYKVPVRVKDLQHWKSFADLHCQPLTEYYDNKSRTS